MPRRADPAAKIERLKQQIAALQAVAAEQAAADRKAARKEEARRTDARRFLVGSFVLSRMPLEVWQHTAPEWWAALDAWAVRPRDREALGLAPATPAPATTPPPEPARRVSAASSAKPSASGTTAQRSEAQTVGPVRLPRFSRYCLADP